MHAGYCRKNCLHIEAVLPGFDLQLMCQYIQQHFGIRVGVDMAQVFREQLPL